MEFSLDRYYGLNRRLLSLIGVWPYQSAKNAWICRGIVMLIIIWSTVAQITKIFMSELTIEFILDVLPVFIPNLGVIFQIVERTIHKNTMKEMLDRIGADWKRRKSQDEIKIMHEYATSARLITKCFLGYLLGGINLYIFYNMIFPQILDVFVPLNESRKNEHPFHAEFFIDNEKYFYLIRLQMYLIILLVLGAVLAHATMFVVYAQHASGMFIVLGHRAERLFSAKRRLNLFKETRSVRKNSKDYRKIILFVEEHRNVLQFVDIIQSCYELNIFVEFLSLIALIGITMVQTVKFSGLSDERSLRSIAFVGGQSIYLFICSYAGQQIIDTSTQLFMKTYSGKWHNMSLWKQKMMLFVMMRCMQTISIRPYNHYVVSLESFSTILQSAISVCMLLRRL